MLNFWGNLSVLVTIEYGLINIARGEGVNTVGSIKVVCMNWYQAARSQTFQKEGVELACW